MIYNVYFYLNLQFYGKFIEIDKNYNYYLWNDCQLYVFLFFSFYFVMVSSFISYSFIRKS